jgi:hypothetical protein
MKAHVLTIKPGGMVCGLYTEVIPLSEIGALKINRMTEIEFNNDSQQWEARDRAGTVLFSHPSRQQCIEWEHRHFNQ